MTSVSTEHAYRQAIERLASSRLNERIPNSLPAHAKILLETMFRQATEEVRIFTGKMAPDIYGDRGIIDAAKQFLTRRGSRIRVLLQDTMDADWATQQPLLKAIADSTTSLIGTFELRCATGVYATGDAKHFAVMDQRGYRFEFSHEGTKAVANFNEPEVASTLISAFDRAFAMAREPIFVRA